jgi:O-antigen biosynthesis protein WbqV
MTLDTVLVGTADSIRKALESVADWSVFGLEVKGAAIVGAGDVSAPIFARAPAWEALNFAQAGVQVVLLTASAPSSAITRAILTRAGDAHMRTLLFADGRVRELTLDDLVGASLGDVDWARIRTRIAGKRVLITGGGGSIGSELARRVATLAPARLTLLDSSEFNLFRMGHDLPDATLALADVRDARAVRRWFERERPQIVFHAAALKQVPMVEMFPSEGVLTNVCGMRHVVDAAHAVGADLVFVSTDKAVDPSGVMGATKRLGELYCQALDRRGAQRAIPVRLGNVLGSAGSVAPLFEAQFAQGGPLTVTDTRTTRFFLSIPQAADVLLQAAAIGMSGESPRGAALVVDMGEALPVVELARDVIRLNGLRPEVDVPITYVGMRPGERLHEQLIAESEDSIACAVEGVTAAMSAPMPLATANEIIDRLTMLAHAGADDVLAAELFAALAIEPAADIAVRA